MIEEMSLGKITRNETKALNKKLVFVCILLHSAVVFVFPISMLSKINEIKCKRIETFKKCVT